MPNGEIREKGRKNEEVVAEHYRKQGYQVLNQNERGFPDLIVLKDKHVLFFVEVKRRGVRLRQEQKDMTPKLGKEGFETKIIDVLDGKIVGIHGSEMFR